MFYVPFKYYIKHLRGYFTYIFSGFHDNYMNDSPPQILCFCHVVITVCRKLESVSFGESCQILWKSASFFKKWKVRECASFIISLGFTLSSKLYNRYEGWEECSNHYVNMASTCFVVDLRFCNQDAYVLLLIKYCCCKFLFSHYMSFSGFLFVQHQSCKT